MFTVKVCQSMGKEYLYEARELWRESSGIVMQIGYEDTIFIGPGGHRMDLNASCRSHDSNSDEVASSTATAYVMNRYGATVATYRL